MCGAVAPSNCIEYLNAMDSSTCLLFSKSSNSASWDVFSAKLNPNNVEKPDELKSFLQFCQKNNLKSTLVITIDKGRAAQFGSIDLTYVPAAMYRVKRLLIAIHFLVIL